MRAGDSVRLRTFDVGRYFCFRAQDRAGRFAFRAHPVEEFRPPPPPVVHRNPPESNPPPNAAFREFSAQQFKELLDSVVLANLIDLSESPAIGGDAETDSRIRRIAVERGYRLKPMVASLGKLVTVEQQLLQPEAARAYVALRQAARRAGHSILLASAYRSLEAQRSILFRKLKPPYADARINAVLRVTAPPGYSRHQTGYAVDLATAEYGINEFRFSSAYAWLIADNFLQAKRYGFVPSYPAGVEKQGPDPEAWEFVYVGTDNLVAPPDGET